MSRKIMWQICHKNLGNKLMTKYIAKKNAEESSYSQTSGI